MSTRYLLDTNVLSEPVRPRPNPHVVRRLERSGGVLATASVVIHEMYYGVERLPPSRKREAIERYLSHLLGSTLIVLPYGTRAARWHARERARLESQGFTPPYRDTQIAAIALANDLVLATANVKDFERIQGLEVEDWSRP